MDSRLASPDKAPERGLYYGWIVVVGAFLIMAISCGALYSYGVFMTPLLTEFGWTRGMASSVTTVAGLTYAATIPVAGLMADKYGFRMTSAVSAGLLGLGLLLSSQIQSVWQLYLTAGILIGLGSSVTVALPFSIVTKWFTRRQGLALGIASCGISLGTATVPSFASFLVLDFGWRAAYVTVGALVCVICIPAALMAMRIPRSSQTVAPTNRSALVEDAPASAEADASLSLGQAVSTRSFWFLFTVYGLCITVVGVTMVHIVPYALDSGLSPMAGAGLITAIGICSLIGRISSGALSDRLGARLVLIACLVVEGLLVLWLVQATDLWRLYAYAALFGISYGGSIPLFPRLTAQLFGSGSMGAVFGGISVADGIGFAVGPLLAGAIFDATGGYQWCFVIIATGLFVAAILTAFLKQPKMA